MSRAFLHLLIGIAVLGLLACGALSTEQLVYDQRGYRVGVELDPTIKRSQEPVQNEHPAKFTAEELQSLLGMIEVSGWSGTLVGILAPPRPLALMNEEDLREVSPYLATAFRQAGPTERVFFSLANRRAPYNDARTAGALFRLVQPNVQGRHQWLRPDFRRAVKEERSRTSAAGRLRGGWPLDRRQGPQQLRPR